MKSFRDRNAYLVGLGSVLALGAAVGFAFAVGIFHLLEHTYDVKAAFSDAAGVRGGDDVRVAGVKAGRVKHIAVDRQHGTVVVSLAVNQGVHLGPQTRAEVALSTLLGAKYVRLSGPVVRPYLEDLPAAQRFIPPERTKTPFDVFNLTKITTRTVEATDTTKLNQFIRDLADVSQGQHDQLTQLLTGLDRVSGALDTRDAQLRQLLDHIDALSRLLAEKDQTLVGLIDQSQAVLALIDRRRLDIAKAIESTNQLATQLGGLVADHRVQLDSILNTLHPTVDILDQRAAVVDRSLSWLGSAALGLSSAGSHGPWLDIYVRALGPDLIAVLKGAIPGATHP